MTELEQEIGSQVQLFVWRIPKKNHDAMVKLQKQFNNILIKHGALRIEIFSLLTLTPMMVALTYSILSQPIKTRKYGLNCSPTKTSN